MKKRVEIILKKLYSLFPEAKMVLKYSNNWELLIAVILSAQCTDKMVNKVTAELFKKYTKFDDYLNADITEFEQTIRRTGFYHMKAKHILESAKIIEANFGGKVPSTMNELMSLPGVARKTANVVLGNAFGVVEGIAVDTHVKRLSRVWGLTKNTDPDKIEKDLMGLIPKKDWFKFTYMTIDYGRAYCIGRRHNHVLCPLTKLLN